MMPSRNGTQSKRHADLAHLWQYRNTGSINMKTLLYATGAATAIGFAAACWWFSIRRAKQRHLAEEFGERYLTNYAAERPAHRSPPIRKVLGI
jgi:hypothetical protein